MSEDAALSRCIARRSTGFSSGYGTKERVAFNDGRHGHPVKLRGEIRAFLLEHCQNHASAASREIQRLVAERFGISVSVSQLNRVRAAHGLSRKSLPREKKAENGRYYCLWIS